MTPTNREIFLRHQAQTSLFPLGLEIERAEGVYLHDTKGRKYIDLISGISVSSLGHGNECVRQAVIDQAGRHLHLMVYGEFVQSPQVQLAQALTALLPTSLDSVYFVNSGAEATEGALKLAKRVTGRQEIIAFRKAYHGSTHAALSLNSEEYFKNAFRPLLPGIRFLDFNDSASLDQITKDTCCVVAETVRGEAGYETAVPGFFENLRARCTATGALLVLDEIQCGMGRTGTLFAFEQENIQPDILLLGKALGAGLPMGAFVASRERMNLLADDPYLGHITTFGGHPLVAAAAHAGLTELTRNEWIGDVTRKEQLFRTKLRHGAVKSISGRGLMLALELDSFESNKRVIDACIADGVITDWFLFAPHKLRIAPPLIISDDEIEAACSVIVRNLDQYC